MSLPLLTNIYIVLTTKVARLNGSLKLDIYIESVPSVSEKYIWIGADDFNIYCVDRLSGKKLFESISGSTSYYVVIGNNQIFSLSVYGELFAFVPKLLRRGKH
jgi:outer membrane protein assembly factor BamB